MRFTVTARNGSSSPSNSAVNYSIVNNYNFGYKAAGVVTQQQVPIAMTLSNWSIVLAAAPGAGTSFTYTVRKNAVDTALSITISDTATTGSDTTNTIQFNPGDTMDIKITPTGTPSAATYPYWSFLGQSMGNNAQPLFHTTTGSVSTDRYYSILGGDTSSTVPVVSYVMPCSGIFSRIGATVGTAPGTGTSWAFKLNVNGSDTALSATIADTATSGIDTTNQVRVAAGDLVAFHRIPTGAVAATTISTSAIFTPDVSGNSIHGFGSFLKPSNVSTVYNTSMGIYPVSSPSWQSTDSYVSPVLPAGGTVTAMYVNLDAAPGSGLSYTFMLRKTNVDTAATVTISSAATTANITGLNIPIATNDYLNIKSAPSAGTPTAPLLRLGFTVYYPPQSGFLVTMM